MRGRTPRPYTKYTSIFPEPITHSTRRYITRPPKGMKTFLVMNKSNRWNRRARRWRNESSIRRCSRMVSYWGSKGYIDLKPNGMSENKNLMMMLFKSFRVIRRMAI